MRIRWFHRAEASLAHIAEYLAERNPRAAYETLARIKAAADMLAQHPFLGRPGRVEGTREWVVTGTPYLLPYRVKDGEIQILHVLHGSRKWPEAF